jgi:metal-responsive CopG/Arc/MetJ family transcriptional regulator
MTSKTSKDKRGRPTATEVEGPFSFSVKSPQKVKFNVSIPPDLPMKMNQYIEARLFATRSDLISWAFTFFIVKLRQDIGIDTLIRTEMEHFTKEQTKSVQSLPKYEFGPKVKAAFKLSPKVIVGVSLSPLSVIIMDLLVREGVFPNRSNFASVALIQFLEYLEGLGLNVLGESNTNTMELYRYIFKEYL